MNIQLEKILLTDREKRFIDSIRKWETKLEFWNTDQKEAIDRINKKLTISKKEIENEIEEIEQEIYERECLLEKKKEILDCL